MKKSFSFLLGVGTGKRLPEPVSRLLLSCARTNDADIYQPG
jgi:hypothetical protein